MTEDQRCGLYCAHATRDGICRPRCFNFTASDLEDLPMLEQSVRDKLYALKTNAFGDRVSGSRERPLGFSEDALSLIGTINNPHLPMRIKEGDEDHQVGALPLMDTLTGWVYRIRQYRRLTFWTPSTVQAACDDLLTHHDWATRHEWSYGYAGQIRTAAHEARRLCGLYDAQPEFIPAVACRHCETVNLWRVPGSRWAAECHGEARNDRGDLTPCGALYTEQEYTDWTKRYAAYVKGKTA